MKSVKMKVVIKGLYSIKNNKLKAYFVMNIKRKIWKIYVRINAKKLGVIKCQNLIKFKKHKAFTVMIINRKICKT